MTSAGYVMQVYRDKAGEWRWRLEYRGKIIADSAEGYTRRSSAFRAATRVAVAVGRARIQVCT